MLKLLLLSCTPMPALAICLRCCMLLASFAFLAGCAKPTLYSWGDYDESLEQRYEKENMARAEELLREQMQAYSAGQRVPPGVYADYGFLLFRRGDSAGAVLFFEKEKNIFPESAFLMNKLIERIKKKAAHDGVNVSSLTEGGQP